MRKSVNSSWPVGARKLLLGALAVATFLVAYTHWVSPTQAAPAPKIEICHSPPGNPANFHTIRVSEHAVPAHLAHGDVVGACNDLCALFCDDGDPCTIDDTGDCESEGCPPAPRQHFECDDGLECTESGHCDPETGACVNPPLPGISCTNSDPSVCEKKGEDNGICDDAGLCVPEGIPGCCEDNDDCDAADTDPCTTEVCDSTSNDPLVRNTCVPDGGGILDCNMGACHPGYCANEFPPADCSTSCRDCCCVELPSLGYPCCEGVADCDDGFDCTDDTCGENDECGHVENCGAGAACNAEGLCEGLCVPPPDSGQCVPAPNGLAVWWPFDADTTDIQSGLNGVLRNGAALPPTSGVVSGALNLDGVNDFVEVPDHPALTTPSGLTLDAWVNATTLVSGGAIVSKYNSRPQVQQISWFLGSIHGDGHLRFTVCDDAVYARCTGVDTDDPVLTEGCWHFVAATFDVATQEAKIYVDGVEVPSSLNDTGIVTSIADTDVPVQIGAVIFSDSDEPTSFWPGLIDELEIYDRALSSPEIQGIYNAGASGKCKVDLPPPPCFTATWHQGSGDPDQCVADCRQFAGCPGVAEVGVDVCLLKTTFPAFEPTVNACVEPPGDSASCEAIDDVAGNPFNLTDPGLPFGGGCLNVCTTPEPPGPDLLVCGGGCFRHDSETGAEVDTFTLLDGTGCGDPGLSQVLFNADGTFWLPLIFSSSASRVCIYDETAENLLYNFTLPNGATSNPEFRIRNWTSTHLGKVYANPEGIQNARRFAWSIGTNGANPLVFNTPDCGGTRPSELVAAPEDPFDPLREYGYAVSHVNQSPPVTKLFEFEFAPDPLCAQIAIVGDDDPLTANMTNEVARATRRLRIAPDGTPEAGAIYLLAAFGGPWPGTDEGIWRWRPGGALEQVIAMCDLMAQPCSSTPFEKPIVDFAIHPLNGNLYVLERDVPFDVGNPNRRTLELYDPQGTSLGVIHEGTAVRHSVEFFPLN